MKGKQMLLRCIEDFTSGPFKINGGMPQETYLGIKILCDIGQHRECVNVIRDFFKIPVTLRIGLQPSERNPECARQKQMLQNIKECKHFFDPSYFFDMLNISEERIEPAQVNLSDNWPLYGTTNFAKMDVTLFIQRWLFFTPTETLISALSHEMAHILLYALKNKYRKSEIATDILAMIITGPKIIKIGRLFGNRRFGYLDDEQFDIVQRAIMEKTFRK